MSKLTRKEMINYLADCWGYEEEYSDYTAQELRDLLNSKRLAHKLNNGKSLYQEALEYNGK